MKKNFLTFVFLVIGFGALTAQENFRPSVHFGLPLGDTSDFFGFNIGAELAYLYPLTDEFSVGGKAGLEVFSGKNIPRTSLKYKNATLIPIAASAQYDFLNSFFVGADLGVALSLVKDYKSGLYFMPRVGMQNDIIQGFIFLQTISSKQDSPVFFKNRFNNLTSIGFGATYKF